MLLLYYIYITLSNNPISAAYEAFMRTSDKRKNGEFSN